MNEQITKNWFKVVIIFITLLFIGITFYWYELRPSVIKKDCYNEAKSKEWNLDYGRERYDFIYKQCLEKKGL